MADSHRDGRSSLLVGPYLFGGVGTGTRFAGTITGHHVSAEHRVQRLSVSVYVGVGDVVFRWSGCPGQILIEPVDGWSSGHGVRCKCLFVDDLGSDQLGQGVSVGGGVRVALTVPCSGGHWVHWRLSLSLREDLVVVISSRAGWLEYVCVFVMDEIRWIKG